MARPLSRAQQLENEYFLRLLRMPAMSARRVRHSAATARFTRRRTKYPAFAAEWDAALAIAHAATRSTP